MSLLSVLASLVLAIPPAAAADRDATEAIEVPGGIVEVTIGPEEPPLPRSSVRRWVENAARAVAAYYGRFPVPRLRLALLTGGGGGVGYGTTWGGDVASIRIDLGRRTTEAVLADDWVLTHEMVHLGFPDLPRQHAWVEEGLATYVEPIARARLGALPVERVWRDLVENLPKGLPGPRDKGLDGTRSWGRTYWGGDLFWLMADVETRERTGNRLGLEDALRGILAEGGDIRESWTLRGCLSAGDRATAVRVLDPLYDRMGRAPLKVDLDDLWRRLGVVRRDDAVAFDDAAPLAAVRRAITGRR